MSSARSPTAAPLTRHRIGEEAADVLACRASADQVGDFLRDRAPGLVLDTLAPVISGAVGEVRCAIERSKLKPGRRLTVSATVHGPGLRSRAVTAIWGSVPAQLADAGADPVAPGVGAPFEVLRLRRAGGGAELHVFVSPLDPTFPALAALHDQDHLAAVLRSHGVEVPAAGVSAATLRYRPGQRHVLRLDLADGRGVYAKCYRDETGVRAAAAWTAVQAALTDWGGPVEAVRPVGYLTAERVMLWEGSGGTALGDTLDDSPEPLRVAGAALRAIHDSPVEPPGRDLRSDPASEAASTLRSCEHVTALLPDLRSALTDLAATAVSRLDARPAESGHRLHGDYKCDNILVEDDRLRLLDLDRVTVGDPALDLGKMTADLRWWAAVRGREAMPLLTAFIEGYGACSSSRLRRASDYDVLFMLRSVGRRIPLHEPRWADRVRTMLAAATHEGVGR